MALSIERNEFDANRGFQYYVSFKPNLSLLDISEEVHQRVTVQASLSISETGDLAHFSFVLPKPCRSEQALTFLRRQEEARIVPPQVFVALPGPTADTVASAMGSLDLDLAGRIIAMEIHWIPDIAQS